MSTETNDPDPWCTGTDETTPPEPIAVMAFTDELEDDADE